MARPKTNLTRSNYLQPTRDSLPTPIVASQVLPVKIPFTDDLIRSLGDSYENKRARQVGEWERTQATLKRPSR
ncbi:MAG: hypothetical protein C4325_10895 [Blastocatellia bacterium]